MFGLRPWQVERAAALWDEIAGDERGDSSNAAWQAVREYKDAAANLPPSIEAQEANEAAIHAVGQAVLWGYAQGFADAEVDRSEIEMMLMGGAIHA